MKKIIMLALSAILALSVFTGCTYDNKDNYKAETAKGTLVNFAEQWAGPTLTIDPTWKKLTVEFASAPSSLQFVLQSDVTYQETWGTAHRCKYQGIDKATVELDLEKVLADLKAGWADTTKIDGIQIQNTGTSNQCFISSVKATKADDSTVDVTIPGPQSWEKFTITAFE